MVAPAVSILVGLLVKFGVKDPKNPAFLALNGPDFLPNVYLLIRMHLLCCTDGVYLILVLSSSIHIDHVLVL